VRFNGYYSLLCPLFYGLIFQGCTNFSLDLLNQRLTDNFSGSLSEPGDIDPSGTNQFSFILTGDTHIGSPNGEVLRQIIGQAVVAGDAFFVISGDITQGGLVGEYRQFKTLFDLESMPYRAAIGNHDIFFSGWNDFKQEIGKSIYSFNADNVHIVVLDSANGILGEDQLNWLRADLEGNTNPHILISTHFPPWNGHFSSIFKMPSDEEVAILKQILYDFDVDIMAAGHYHGYTEHDIGRTKFIVSGGANDVLDPGESKHFIRITVNGESMTHQMIEL
jgi:hypothetical protein